LNGPASPTPVSDGRNVYVFFYDFGLVSYAPDGNELWRLPLGPFNNPFGMAASPVLAGGTLVQVCDGETGSFVVAIDTATGKVKWRKERPGATRGFSTPLIYRPENGPVQALVAGSLKLVSYSVESGEELWFVRGLTWQLKPTPVMDRDTIYVLGWAGGADPGEQEDVQSFEEMLQRLDRDKDGKLSKEEIGDPKIVKDWAETDLDHTGYLEARDWEAYRNKRSAQNGFTAFRLGGQGDMTGKNFLWRYTKSLPNATSPLLYRNVLYLVKDGGILTSLDPRSGEVLKQARINGAAGAYYSSPVAADGRIYTLSEDGQGAVLKAGPDWELLRVNDLAEQAYASPAIVDGKIYLRTQSALYCFANRD
jgi:outer membrane protein assembly factor BamB